MTADVGGSIDELKKQMHRLERNRFTAVSVFLGSLAASSPAWSQEASATSSLPVGNLDWLAVVCWAIAFVGALLALGQAKFFYESMIVSDPGNDRMKEIASYVTRGANAYLGQQYRVVAAFFVIIALVLAAAAYLEVQSDFVPFAFLTGGFFSGLAGWFGMRTATAASNRTAAAAQKSLNRGLRVAFRSGAVMGLTVVGLALMDITLWFAFLYWIWPAFTGNNLGLAEITVTMLSFGMGASAQALFARVGGGIFTKAADVGADLVGKVEQGIPEDDPRNPATIADNVGDNVGDVAGMGADLYESYAGSILATAALGAAAYAGTALLPEGMLSEEAQLRSLFLPMVIAGLGICMSIVGIYMVKTEEDASQKTLLNALGRGINRATLLVAVLAILAAYLLMPQTPDTQVFGTPVPGVALSIVIGLLAGWLIGWWTEYSTSSEYDPTKKLAEQSLTGPATIIIGGIADGMMSVWFPVLTVAVATIASFGFASGWHFGDLTYFSLGLYGVGISAVGMLSTLGITLATDAYGPIADNAGGNAEMSGLPEMVRERTDALDSLGNTTAATGKGFAIGSAALTALALLAAYIEGVRVGFERWALSEAAVISADGGSAGYYKLSRQFVARFEPPASDDGETTTARGMQVAGAYLILPGLINDPQLQRAWAAIPIGAAVSEGGGAAIQENNDGEVAFAVSGDRLLPLADASLPQFTAYYDATLMNPKILVGIFCGAMATFVFCALTMKAVGRAAHGMVEEVRRQFRELPGIMAGTDKPDYERPVEISTQSAQREMMLPAMLGLLLPIVVGLVLGVGGVLGLLVGTLTCGFCVAVFMANAGGSWDNAKKYIEAGAHGGKYLKNESGQFVDPTGNVVEHREDAKNPAHGAAVIGDTVGDPFKDTSGPSLNILIKLMSMVSVVIAGLVVRYSLVALGIF